MNRQFGFTLLPVIMLLMTVAFALGGYFLWQSREDHGQALGPYTPTASESASPILDVSWRDYKNEQLGFSLKFPQEKNFTITTAQNKVSFLVPYTENGFVVTAYNNPEILSEELWLKNNFSKLYSGLTFQGQPLSFRDVRIFNSAFYVGDLPPVIFIGDSHIPLIFKIETDSLEKKFAEEVLRSFKVLERFDPIDTSLYENRKAGVSFVYPKSGMVEEEPNGWISVWQDKDKREIIPSEAPPGTPHVSIVVFGSEEEITKTVFRQERLKEKATSFTFLGEKPLTLANGVEAVEDSFESSLGSWSAVYLTQNSRIYRFNYQTAYGPKGKQFFDQILATLKFL